jgi:hypothetical protein
MINGTYSEFKLVITQVIQIVTREIVGSKIINCTYIQQLQSHIENTLMKLVDCLAATHRTSPTERGTSSQSHLSFNYTFLLR